MSDNQPTNQPDHVLKQTNKQTPGARVQRTFDVPVNEEGVKLLEMEKELLKREKHNGWSKADLCRQAWREYIVRHHPGNPTPPLSSFFPGGPPLSEAAREKITKPKTETCDKCDGTGVDKRDGHACPACGGHGVVYIE